MTDDDPDLDLPWTVEELALLHAGALPASEEKRLRTAIEGDLEALLVLDGLDRVETDLLAYGDRAVPPPPGLDLPTGHVEAETAVETAAGIAAGTAAGMGREDDWSGREHRSAEPGSPPRRRPVLVCAAVVAGAAALILALVVAVAGENAPASAPLATPGRPADVPADVPVSPDTVVGVDLPVVGVASTTLLMGRLDQIAGLVGRPATLDGALLAAQPGVCAQTVVARGFPGRGRTIVATGLPGWRAAEALPAEGDDSPTVHQRVVVPPADSVPGAVTGGSVQLGSSELGPTTAPVRLALVAQRGEDQLWDVGGRRIECSALR